MQNEIMAPRRTPGKLKLLRRGDDELLTSKKSSPPRFFKGATFRTSIEFSSIFIQGDQREGDARVEQEDANGHISRGGRH